LEQASDNVEEPEPLPPTGQVPEQDIPRATGEEGIRSRYAHLDFVDSHLVACMLLRVGCPLLYRTGFTLQKQAKQIAREVDLVQLLKQPVAIEIGCCMELPLGSNRGFERGLICLDVDNRETWDRILTYVLFSPDGRKRSSSELPLINPTDRGGHLIYKAPLGVDSKTKIGTVTNLGVKVDDLTNKVQIVGIKKAFIGPISEVDCIAELPTWFYKKGRKTPDGDLITGEIMEGTRNDTVFKNLISLGLPWEERFEVAQAINNIFCSPKLGLDELRGLVDRTESAPVSQEAGPSTTAEKNQRVADIIKADLEIIETLVKGLGSASAAESTSFTGTTNLGINGPEHIMSKNQLRRFLQNWVWISWILPIDYKRI